MVIEMLMFEVAASDQKEWLRVDDEVWGRFLERQDGFVRREMWVSRDEPTAVHALIWWESLEQWEAIAADEVAAIDERMGPWLRQATMRAFDQVRVG